jgi:ABC-type polysaccharide/polyol phosphate export permease
MAGIVASFRTVLLGLGPPDPRLLGIATLEAIVALWVGYRIFKSLERYFADVV